MRLEWSEKALGDLARLYDFLALINQNAAARMIQSLTRAPDTLLAHPRLGQRLEQYPSREMRKIIVGSYELRYEIRDDTISVVRLWHTSEDR